MSEETTYNSHRLYQLTRKFIYKRAALAVKTSEDKSRATTIVLVMLLIMSFIGGSFAGIALDIHVISPPQTFVGICSPPAQMIKNGCFIVSQSTVNGKTITNYSPTGQVCSANETIIQCERR
jgi:hypothetical protein